MDPATHHLEAGSTDGGTQAIDQIAHWVRFADTKATILTAGLGLVLTMLMTNARTIAEPIGEGGVPALVVGCLTAAALVAFLWTLFWLVRAIGPQRTVTYARLNRFAWPSLVKATTSELISHSEQVDVREVTWQQVIDLSRLADRKFDACGKAVWGFAALVLFGLFCVAVAVGFST